MSFDILIVLLIIAGISLYYFFNTRVKQDPQKKARTLVNENKLEEAIAEFKRILYSNPDDTSVHFSIAQLYHKLNKIDETVFHLNEIIRINKYGPDFNKLDVMSKLANIYLKTNNLDDAIGTYINILNDYPDDPTALYHVSFSILGQEEFEIAQKYFNKLVKHEDTFEVFFGIGICSYQNQNMNDALKYFKEALSLKPEAEIALLAVSLALFYSNNYKEGVTYIKKLINKTEDESVKFIGMRIHAFLLILSKQYNKGIDILEEMLSKSRGKDNKEEVLLTLYDTGYAYVMSNKKKRGYNIWFELSQIDNNYKNISQLISILQKEIDKVSEEEIDEFDIPIADTIESWITNAFSMDFLWSICGLKSNTKIDIKNMLVTKTISVKMDDTSTSIGTEEKSADSETQTSTPGSSAKDARIEAFCNMDTEKFRITSNRLVSKLDLKVDEFLQTYREADGVDFVAKDNAGKTVLIWVRRWQGTKVGEISIRNFAQAINDIKATRGLFLTTAKLTSAAQDTLKQLQKVTIVYPDEISSLLKGLV